jgi:hypothetical protein
VLYGFCVVLGAAALVLTFTNSGQSALLLVVLAILAFLFLRSLGYVRLDRIPESAMDRKRNRALRAAVRPLGRRLRHLRNLDDMWPVVIEAGKALGAVTISLELTHPLGTEPTTPTPTTFSFGPEDSPPDDGLRRFRFFVPGSRSGERTLELGWADGRPEVDRDTEIAIDIFCEYLGEALEASRQTNVGAGLRSRGAAPRA